MSGSFNAYEEHIDYSFVTGILPLGVLCFDREGFLVAANRGAAVMFGLPVKQMIGKSYDDPLLEISSNDGIPLSDNSHPVYTALKTKTSTDYSPVLVKNRSGNSGHCVQATAYPYPGSPGDQLIYIYLILVSQPADSLNRAAETSPAAGTTGEEDDAAEHAKNRFLSNMSHEIRTPINIIIGMTDLISRAGLNPEQQEYAGMVKDAADTLLTLFNNVLDFSQIEADRLELSSEQFELKTAFEQIAEPYRERAALKQLDFTLKVDSELGGTFFGDLTRIKQVISNLLDNAIKFTNAGMISLKIYRGKDQPGGGNLPGAEGQFTVCFEISDTGIGIPAAKFDMLFKSFSRIDDSSGQVSGTGLGLAISKKLAQLMGGKVWFDSEPGRGSTFYFSLPLKSGPSKPGSSITQTETGLSGKAGQGLNLLLVEDKPMNQRLALVLLENLGHSAALAINGKEALIMAGQNRYDAILMDINMPEMDGLEATRLIRAAEKDKQATHVPIIAMTAAVTTADRSRYLKAGINYLISKPIQSAELANILGSAVAAAHRTESFEQNGDTVSRGGNEMLDDIKKMAERFENDHELIAELVSLFIEDYHDELVLVNQAIKKNDLAALKTAIHGLKGEIGNLGLTRTYQLAAEIDSLLGKNQLENALEPLEELKDRVGRLEGFFAEQGWPAKL